LFQLLVLAILLAKPIDFRPRRGGRTTRTATPHLQRAG
jgi:hypothetical protein